MDMFSRMRNKLLFLFLKILNQIVIIRCIIFKKNTIQNTRNILIASGSNFQSRSALRGVGKFRRYSDGT